MARWLKIKYLLLHAALEALILWILKISIRVGPLSSAVFLSIYQRPLPAMIAVLEFVLVRLTVFLLVCASADWFKEDVQFLYIRLGRKRALQESWIHIFLSSLVLHLILILFCGTNYLLQAILEGLLLSILLCAPRISSRKYYPVLFLVYLLVCLLIP